MYRYISLRLLLLPATISEHWLHFSHAPASVRVCHCIVPVNGHCIGDGTNTSLSTSSLSKSILGSPTALIKFTFAFFLYCHHVWSICNSNFSLVELSVPTLPSTFKLNLSKNATITTKPANNQFDILLCEMCP